MASGGRGGVRALARLAAEAIDVAVTVVTIPAKWAATSLRWYGGHGDTPPPTDADRADPTKDP
jgi:hypothetical protein